MTPTDAAITIALIGAVVIAAAYVVWVVTPAPVKAWVARACDVVLGVGG